MEYFKQWWNSLFQGKENKPESIVTDVHSVPILNIPTPPVQVVNSGNTARPDWVYLWSTCVIDEPRLPEVAKVCAKIMANWDRYNAVSKVTGIPEVFIGAVHFRESSMSFTRVLHNGDYILGKGTLTYNVPKGRGPFNTWEESAIDALKLKSLHSITNWDTPTMLKHAERFNGLGYRNKGEYSPYIFAGTNHSDETGKYTSDGKFSNIALEKQLGVAAIIKGLEILYSIKI